MRPVVRRALRSAALAALALALIAAVAGVALARPGGGQTFGGGGGGGGDGGGDGALEGLIWLLLQLLIEVPHIGVPLVVIVIVGWIVFERSGREARTAAWDSVPVLPPVVPRTVDLEPIRALDPDFSPVLFDDFLYRLIAQAHLRRAVAGGLDELAPYLDSSVRSALSRRASSRDAIDGVVIGTLRAIRLRLPTTAAAGGGTEGGGDGDRDGYYRIGVEVELNATGPRQTWHVREEWHLRRRAGVRSRPPSTTRALLCPNCGAPFRSSDGHRCAHCDQVVDGGRFDWQVTGVLLHQESAQPPSLTGTVPERGTTRPTVTHPARDVRLAELRAGDPALDDAAIDARLRLIYAELNAGWNARDLGRIRPWVSDGMLDYMRYWLEAYAKSGLENHHDDAAIERFAIVKVVRDAHFDALTVRLWGHGKDYTIAAGNQIVVGGSRAEPRHFTEYWTLIRGAAVRGAPRVDKRCPNCGAELRIAMGGTCAFCQVHVTSGEFDWVLSKIEQDDVYAG